MDTIICENNIGTIMGKLQEYIDKNSMLGGMLLVDETEEQVVILLDKEPIDKKIGEAYWLGYQAALK